MTQESVILCITAASIGFLHTLLGPDHYVPFVVMAKAGKWSIGKTAFITLLCGIGHVAGSILLGAIGIALGVSLAKLEIFESFRGELAAWALVAFGLMYTAWGIRQAYRSRPHAHVHAHNDGTIHTHKHAHQSGHMHVHKASTQSMTPWILFTIFVFGPCEPLIPLLMYPASKINLFGVVMVAGVFSLCTIGTMLSVVLLSSYGLKKFPTEFAQRYSHALAGGAVCLCGLGIVVLGL